MEVEVANPLSGYPVSTILWFEYLLDSSLLEKQLKRENSGKNQITADRTVISPLHGRWYHKQCCWVYGYDIEWS